MVTWYRNAYCLKHHKPRCVIYSVPNDGYNVKEQMVKRATGLLPGVSDLVIMLPGPLSIYVEVKIESGGVQSDAQKEFEQTVTALGFRYVIVRSLDEFKEFIMPFMDKIDRLSQS